jgi:hypothetical protein
MAMDNISFANVERASAMAVTPSLPILLRSKESVGVRRVVVVVLLLNNPFRNRQGKI